VREKGEDRDRENSRKSEREKEGEGMRERVSVTKRNGVSYFGRFVKERFCGKRERKWRAGC